MVFNIFAGAASLPPLWKIQGTLEIFLDMKLVKTTVQDTKKLPKWVLVEIQTISVSILFWQVNPLYYFINLYI